MSVKINATGSVDADGTPQVEITFSFTVPLGDADAIARLIKIGGTRAVLSAGIYRQQQELLENPAPPSPESVNGQCVSDTEADLAALDAAVNAISRGGD